MSATPRPQPGASQSAESAPPEPPSPGAAVTKLGLASFLQQHAEQIYARLQQFDAVVMTESTADVAAVFKGDRDTLFLAESLPFVNSVIQVGSPNAQYIQAIEWMRKVMPDAAPVSILTGLVFLYIVEAGTERFKTHADPAVQEAWMRIGERAKKLKGNG